MVVVVVVVVALVVVVVVLLLLSFALFIHMCPYMQCLKKKITTSRSKFNRKNDISNIADTNGKKRPFRVERKQHSLIKKKNDCKG